MATNYLSNVREFAAREQAQKYRRPRMMGCMPRCISRLSFAPMPSRHGVKLQRRKPPASPMRKRDTRYQGCSAEQAAGAKVKYGEARRMLAEMKDEVARG